MTRALLGLLLLAGTAHATDRLTKAFPTPIAAAQAEGTRRLNGNASARAFEGKVKTSDTFTSALGAHVYQVSGLTMGVGDAPEYATTVKVLALKSGDYKAYTASPKTSVYNLNANP